MKKSITPLAMFLLAVGVSACGQRHQPEQFAAGDAAQAQPTPSVYESAVANAARPAADRERDAGRKPAAVLSFVGIQPGMTVLDMFSGGGYYTEILSYVVGQSGRVVAHSNKAYLDFVGEEFEQRYLGGRLPNVDVLMAENNELTLEPGSLDAVMLVLSFHDLFYVAPEDGWPAIDVAAFLAELHSGLRPGGIVGIVDHRAAAGAPRATGGTLHRIDPAIVLEEMTSAGFVLDAKSEVLQNPDDDYGRGVFEPDIRGKTDRFVMRFVKPE